MNTARRTILSLIVLLGLSQPAQAQPGFDAISNSAGGAGSQSWTHTPVGTPRGVWVYCGQVSQTDEITSITYGGVSMTESAGSPNLLTSGELGASYSYFLGTSIPSGAQTVAMTGTTGAVKQCFAVSITASADTEIVDVDGTINSASVTNPSVTLSLSGRTSFAAIGFYSGGDAVTNITELAGWTNRFEGDAGNEVFGLYSYDTIGSADVAAGWTQTTEDAAAVAIAISEVAGGATQPQGMMIGIGGARK